MVQRPVFHSLKDAFTPTNKQALLPAVSMILLASLWLAGCGRARTQPTSEPPPATSASAESPSESSSETPRAVTTPGASTGRALPTAAPVQSRLVPPPDRDQQVAAIPALATRTAAFAAVLAADAATPPVLTLPVADLSDEQAAAQRVALADGQFLRWAVDDVTGERLRSEIFGVEPLRPSDLSEATAACAERACYRVILYNYALNITSTAVVDLENATVLEVAHLQDGQPELTSALTDLVLDIAANAPEVREELGQEPGMATMANVKTALNNTACESSRHLCVAPTFIVDNRALWAIVDLTDERLVGLRWTDLGDFSAGRPTQELIARDDIFENYCNTLNHLAQDGWAFDYILTASDGLRVSDVTFQEQPVLASAKVVDFHVSYSEHAGFGYSDAVGCPMFSSSAVIATSAPSVEPIVEGGETLGFALVQDYANPLWPAPCNYRYEQRYEFYRDGSFRPIVTNLGRGCGNDGVYRPILRIEPAASEDGHRFAGWTGEEWDDWQEEQWRLQDDEAAYTAEGYQYRITGGDGLGYYLEPGNGQFPGERGDHAYVYITVAHPDEGASDLVTIGACCNPDHRQGPEQFIDATPEPLDGENLVIWYVPQIENDDTPGQEYCWADLTVEDGLFVPRIWPCSAGPRFVPVDAATP